MALKPTFISLFSGVGGFDLGFQQAGFECLAAVDNDPNAIQVHSANIASNAIVGDLLDDFTFSIAPDAVIAGPPCQGFSIAGPRRHDDPRNHLLVRAAELAVGLAPRVIVIENVPGAKTGTHREYWIRAAAELTRAGYHTAELLLQGVECGVPQMRKRVVMFGWMGQRDLPALSSTAGGVLADIIADVDGLPNHEPQYLPEDSEIALIAQAIGPGQKLSNVRGGKGNVPAWAIPQVYGSVTDDERLLLEALRTLRRLRRLRLRDTGDADPVLPADLLAVVGDQAAPLIDPLVTRGFLVWKGERLDLSHTFNGLYWRPRMDRPSPTVDTRFGDPRHFLHPLENRGFTVREAARIQGFPDDFSFSGPLSAQFRHVGNAVPPPMGRLLADLTRSLLGGD